MRIKQIELTGFKSFAEKTPLKLHRGITCIVGPNGCGKSNVVDAFKWVLGEQSVKSLRGERMEEVIFQGSSNVKQKGMAEVMLILSQGEAGPAENGNGDSHGDSIIVARRLYRSGESEYYLNKKQCRLKDIKDIFLDTGLDVKSYSILDQGKVSEIINTKPQDRRFLIEEVAGVMKYKIRKNEALSKLESSKQNLQRVNDIVYEVKRQINSLDRQVKKAERYKRLIEELKSLELRIAKREHLRLAEALTELLSTLERLREVDSSKRSELSTLENQLEVKRLELVGKEKELAELETTLYARERDISETEKQIAVLKNSIENTKQEIARLTQQQHEFDIKKEELLKRIAEVSDNISDLSTSMAGIADELREKKDALSDIEATIAERESAIEEKRRDLFRASETISQKRNDLHKFQSSLETLNYRESTSISDRATITEGIAALEKAIAEAEESIQASKAHHTSLQMDRDMLVDELEQLSNEIEERKLLLARERETLASNNSRLASLKELTIDTSLHDVLSKAVDVHPAACGEDEMPAAQPVAGSDLSTNCLVLSDIINADSDYERAIEAALAEKVNTIILNSVDQIIAAVAIIKEKQLGRTALLYTGFRTAFPDAASGAPALSHEAIIGKASDFISYDKNDVQGTIIARILENTYIVKDLARALSLKALEPFSNVALVTLDGEFIGRDGVILVGQGKDILKRKREIKELQRTIQAQQETIERTEYELNDAAASLASRKEALKSLESSLVDVEKEISLAEHSLAGQKEEIERKRRKLSFLDTELAAIAEDKESLKSYISIKTEEINLAEQEKTVISEEITTYQNALVSIKAEYEAARARLTDMQLTIASYKEKIEGLQREEGMAHRAIGDLEIAKENAARGIQEAEQRLETSLAELQTREEAIKVLVNEVDAMRQERAIRKEAIEAESQLLIEENAALRQIRSDIDLLAQELTDANAKSVEHRLRLENIETGIMQKYGLEIKQEQIETEGFEPAEDESRTNELNEKIRDLGPVNLGTIEEYEELKTRYDFLTKQQQDLTMSIAELEEAISRINASTRRKLREAYDALRTKFAEVFTTIFGGGKADILLTDEENILDSGLEIIAQPPGKKLQNLNLLSGGEKALTSLALLFAGFLIKPSPLCILDEVDAPLDESNTVRFAQMIKELSRDTQFVVITHNKTTMEVADYLYGITMEEPGVSKAISLQFAEIESVG